MSTNNKIKHIAIIMDGNRRWAKERGLHPWDGHNEGTKRIKEIVDIALSKKIENLTMFAFSIENRNRDEKEVDYLMNLLHKYLKGNDVEKMIKSGVKIKMIGDKSLTRKDLVEEIDKIEKKTENNNKMILQVALNYSGRHDIVRATKNIANDLLQNKISLDSIEECIFSNYLYTNDTPDPDIIIRPGGVHRVSNFLMWQMSYSELFFSDKLWPDFTGDDFLKIIDQFGLRDRRYGK